MVSVSDVEELFRKYDAIEGPELELRHRILTEIQQGLSEIASDSTDWRKLSDLHGRWTELDGILKLNPEFYSKTDSASWVDSFLSCSVEAYRQSCGSVCKSPMRFFAYDEFRPGQRDGIEAVRSNGVDGGVLFLNSPTGTGKTSLVLAGLLNSLEEGDKVVVLTRTHSQYDNFLRELGLLNTAGFGVPSGFLKGKEDSCPAGVSRFRCNATQLKGIEQLKDGAAVPCKGEFLMNSVKSMRDGILGHGCPYYVNTFEYGSGGFRLRSQVYSMVKSFQAAPKDAESFRRRCLGLDYPACPYEAMKRTLQDSRVMVLHYIYFLNDRIRDVLFERGWLGCQPEQVHMVFDEAHNLGQHIIESNTESFSLRELIDSVKMLENSLTPGGDYDLSKIQKDALDAISLLSGIEESIRQWFREKVMNEKDFSGRDDLPLDVESVDGSAWVLYTGIPAFTVDLEKCKSLEKVSAEVERQFEAKASGEEMPELFDSPVVCNVSAVLDGVAQLTGDRYLKYVRYNRSEQQSLGLNTVGDYVIRICFTDIDPREKMKTLQSKSKSITLMSGTLSPTNLFREFLLYPDIPAKESDLDNPFPKENRKIIIVPDATTLYSRREDAENKAAIGNVIEYLASFDGNVGAFFPSKTLLESYRKTCEEACRRHRKQLFVEEPKTDKNTLIRDFKKTRNGMIAGYCRGSLSEGIDYPGEQMLAVAVFGLPLAPPSKLQTRIEGYYTKRGMDGKTLTYTLPAVIAATQALGRCIRSETDKGTLILAEHRYTQPGIKRLLPKWIGEEADVKTSGQLSECL